MASNRNGPALWDTLLDAVNVPGAVVAGGSIRDWCLGIDPKDIDIFAPFTDTGDFYDWAGAFIDNSLQISDLKLLGSPAHQTDGNDEDYAVAFGNDLHGVLEGELLGLPVNIIARTAHTDRQSLIDSFDFNILQACYSYKDKFLFNPGQASDLMGMRATMAHDRHIDQSIARFMRFNERNPGLLSLNIPFEQDSRDASRS